MIAPASSSRHHVILFSKLAPEAPNNPHHAALLHRRQLCACLTSLLLQPARALLQVGDMLAMLLLYLTGSLLLLHDHQLLIGDDLLKVRNMLVHYRRAPLLAPVVLADLQQ